MLHHVLEVPRRGGERLFEGLADPAVRLLDEALELGQRGLEVAALGLELLDVLHRPLVPPLRGRVHRAELLAPALEPFDSRLERLALLGGERLRRRLCLQPESTGDRPQLTVDLGGGVARLLGPDLRAGHRLARLHESRLEIGLLVRAGTERRGRLLSRPRAGVELRLQGVAVAGHRFPGGLERPSRPVGVGADASVAVDAAPERLEGASPLDALALDPFGESTLRSQIAEQLCAPHRLRPLLRRLAPAGDHPFAAAHVLLRLGRLPERRAQRALRPVAGGVRLRHVGGRPLRGGPRAALLPPRWWRRRDGPPPAPTPLGRAGGPPGGPRGGLAGTGVEDTPG